MATLEQTTETVADAAVYCWRLEELERAGYTTWDASVLAAARHVDLHAALRLVEQGCPPATAARILA